MDELKVSFFLIADYAFAGESGKLGIIGIFDILGTTDFPRQHPIMYVVVNFKGIPSSTHEVEFQIISPSGKELLLPKPPKLKFTLSAAGSGNVIQSLLGVEFQEPGVHKINLMIHDQKIAETNLSVVKSIIVKNG